MARAIESADQFTIIGENIHATRIVLRNGRRATTLDDGTEAITWTDAAGQDRLMIVPEHFKESQAYEQGQHKHFMIAIWKGLHGDADESADGAAYIHREIEKQTNGGATFLDLNVDEVSPMVDEQKNSMKWLIQTVQQHSTLPPSVDSSLPDIIEEGFLAYDRSSGRPMLNSIALERIEVVDLAVEHKAHVVVTAAGRDGMPSDKDERVANASEVVEACLSAGIPASDIHVDALVFPIAVDGGYGMHFLSAVAELRENFGSEIHIGGGLSNVSFGIPNRQLVNDAFLYLAIEHGADSGIIDPITTRVQAALDIDLQSERVKLAMDMLMGEDDFCMNYITAHRDGRLKRG
ncbi:MAG: dihydropteroate synthase [Chloroflexi bacterium]|nr:dihydropteroate synthase [Chloroflexota bacterium]